MTGLVRSGEHSLEIGAVMEHHELPIPQHFNPDKVGDVWRVSYQERATEAEKWAQAHNIAPSDEDTHKISLLLVDVQNTFCIPDLESQGGKHLVAQDLL